MENEEKQSFQLRIYCLKVYKDNYLFTCLKFLVRSSIQGIDKAIREDLASRAAFVLEVHQD